jgi:uncharacterized membrane protein YphA (DoxX/SURF4 family)
MPVHNAKIRHSMTKYPLSLHFTKNELKAWSFSLLRIIIGWHLLYEGIVKIFNPNWTSAHYLRESKWLFSGFFQWIISDSTALHIADFLNAWGLVVIGFMLFTGIFTRIASISGALLLLLYYVANPPFVYSSIPSVSHFYIINYNLIEAFILIILAMFPRDYLYGVQRLFYYYHSKRKADKFPPADNPAIAQEHSNTRRELIKNLAVIPLFGAVFFGMAKKRGWVSFEEENLAARTDGMTGASLYLGKEYSIHELKGKVPAGIIKDVTLSRLIIGGNLISGFAHSRDLIYVSTWLKKYFTDEKVIETLWLCQASGINTAIFRCDEDTIRILKKFWSRGGKMQWLAQTYPDGDDLTNVKLAVDNGAVGALIQGGIADRIVLNSQLEYIHKPIEYIRSQGLIAGTAAHSMTVPLACTDNGIKPDFFMQTFHHHNSAYTCDDPGKVESFFRNCSIPLIAFKILAAGAIKPEEGFRRAFEGGADFACVGMFDFQVIENANIAYTVLGPGIRRERKWYA